MSSRTFGQDTSEFNALESAISSFVASAAYKLRQSNQLAKKASVFVTNNRNKSGYKKLSKEISFDMPTADSGIIIHELVRALSSIYESNISYHRAGVMLYDFTSQEYLQMDLINNVDMNQHSKSKRRMQAIDSLNAKYGKGSVSYASEKLVKSWLPKKNLQSPRYTTVINELPKAKIVGY